MLSRYYLPLLVGVGQMFPKCDTMSVVRQADDPFVCFGAKPDKGFGLEISTRLEVGKGTRVTIWTKELREVSWRRTTDRAVDTGQQRDQSDEMRSRAVREDESR